MFHFPRIGINRIRPGAPCGIPTNEGEGRETGMAEGGRRSGPRLGPVLDATAGAPAKTTTILARLGYRE